MLKACNSRQCASIRRSGHAGISRFIPGEIAFACARCQSKGTASRATLRGRNPGALLLYGIFLLLCTLPVTSCISVQGVVVTPTSVSWQGVPVGSVGSSQTVTLTNPGSSRFTISSISISGANSGDFSVASQTCGNTLPAGSSCTATLVFSPKTAGTLTANLVFMDNNDASPPTVSLSGVGTVAASTLSINPASLSFGTLNVGSSSPAQTVTLQNGGSGAVSISSIGIGGTDPADFAISANLCGTTLAASASCTVSVTFTPTAVGTRSAALTFTDNGANSPQTLALSGTGGVATASVSPASLSFPATTIGTTAGPQTVTLINGGAVSLSITSIAISGASAADFAIAANACGTTLAASASCTVGITFKPVAAGARTATLVFTDSAGSSAQTVALSGTGNGASTSVSPASVSFPATTVGATSTAQPVVLSNGATVAMSIGSVGIAGADAGDFAISANNCGGALAGNGNCTVSLIFKPTATGARSATLTFTDSAGNSPQTVPLSGTGSPVSASVTPASLTFSATYVGAVSPAQAVTLSNGTTVSFTISNVAISGADAGDFVISNNTCGATLAGQGSCAVSIAFKPTAAGIRSATLTFTDSAGNNPQTVALSGTAALVDLNVAPASLTFASTAVGGTGSPQSITLSNAGTTAININSIAVSGANAADFAISGKTCGPTLPGPGSCTVTIAFTPLATGARAATLTITDSAGNSPQAISLAGSGSAFSISPLNPSVTVNQTLQFSANAPSTWSATCGTMTNTYTGLYTAPSSAGTCTVTATETASPRATLSTQITVVASSSSLVLYPSTADVAVNSQQVFQAQLSQAPDSDGLSYSVDGVSGGNATTGTVDSQGLYTAPPSPGMHLVAVTDNSLGFTATASVNVYSNVTVDFGSRAPNANPVPAGLFGAQYLESLHSTADLDLALAGGFTSDRSYAQIVNVFATSTPNWAPIDSTIRKVTASGGVHVMLEMYQSPAWLQQGTCGVESMPSDINAWASIAQQYVQHMDATFPGIVTEYEIWNEPDIALCVPAGESALTDYIKLYSAAAPLMKAQAKADGQTIRIGGPVTAGLDSTWVTAVLSDPVVSQNIDFLSYHEYLTGKPGETAQWDTYNGTRSIYQITQDNEGPANVYEYAGGLAAAGKQPQGKNLPIYLTEYNLDWLFVKNCCSDDFTYSPVWNALYVADLLDVPFAYTGAPNTMSRLIYYAATNPPYYCLLGVYDANMDCAYPAGSTPQPYPQYFTYQLFGSPSYLGLQNGGYMAASMSPPRLVNGLVVTAFFTPTLDAIVLINPSQYTYTNMPINIANSGFTSAQAMLYQIVNGQSIQAAPLTLTLATGTSYSATVTMGPYSVQAIALH
jgi:hypothetical protein